MGPTLWPPRGNSGQCRSGTALSDTVRLQSEHPAVRAWSAPEHKAGKGTPPAPPGQCLLRYRLLQRKPVPGERGGTDTGRVECDWRERERRRPQSRTDTHNRLAALRHTAAPPARPRPFTGPGCPRRRLLRGRRRHSGGTAPLRMRLPYSMAAPSWAPRLRSVLATPPPAKPCPEGRARRRSVERDESKQERPKKEKFGFLKQIMLKKLVVRLLFTGEFLLVMAESSAGVPIPTGTAQRKDLCPAIS